MKKWLANYTITPAAIVLLAIFITAAVFAFVGAWPLNAVGFLVAAATLALPAMAHVSAERDMSVQERREGFPATRYNRNEEQIDVSVEADDWEHERQR